MQETWVRFLGWEDPLEKEQLPNPVSLPWEFYRQRSLQGYNPWGRKESYMTKWQHKQKKNIEEHLQILWILFYVKKSTEIKFLIWAKCCVLASDTVTYILTKICF